MSKKMMVSAVISCLSSMGIQYTTGGSADILINQEFLKASWNSGNKKISYQASAFFNENEKTVYLWEMTSERGAGSSSGDGYEINIDLGAIPKSFKETSQEYGWRFKTVKKKEKACYPNYPQQDGMSRQTGGKASVPFFIAFSLLALATAFFMLFGENSIIGWGIGAAILFLYFLLGKRFTTKGYLLQITLFVVTLSILLIAFAYTTPLTG